MEILIHGTKYGYKVLHKTKGFPSTYARDMRREDVVNTRTTIGQFTYSIAFSNSGFIFSKYLGVWDFERKAIGNIIFSVYLPGNKRLAGKDLINLLDELSERYWNKYIVDGNIHNTHEDWTLFDTLANKYDSQLHNDDIEDIEKGEGEAAFIYYSDGMELQKYFDAPYQEEYSAYKQVFFVEKQLDGKNENPLNALRHDQYANLTGKIDWENPKYKLFFRQQAKGGVRIDVKVNGKPRQNKDRIRRKEELVIIWSKPFFDTKEIRGRWNEISSDYLIKNDSEQYISVVEIDLQPILHSFIFETKDRIGPINDAEITLKCKGYLPELNVKENKILMTEEELQKSWTVIAKKNNLISEQREIKIEDANRSITLTLYERKKVIFHITDENQPIHNCIIKITDKKVQPINDEVEFLGEEVDKTWQISVSHKNYETEFFKYCPKDGENPKYITLKKNKKPGGGDPPEGPINKPWYKRISIYAWVSIYFVIFLIALFIFLKPESKEDEPPIITKGQVDGNRINDYVEGIELNRDTLEQYKSSYCSPENSKNYNEPEQSLLQKIWPFGSKDNETAAQESDNLPDFCTKIDDAIALRNALNNVKIDELKGKRYSEKQQNFKSAINSIEDKFLSSISDTLHDRRVSQMNLNEIAVLIQKVQNKLIANEATIKEKTKEREKIDGAFTPIKQKETKINNPVINPESKTKTAPTVKNSLENEFWGLVNSGETPTIEKYKGILKRHSSEGGDIIKYLNKICKNTASFQNFKNSEARTRIKARTLTELENNIK